MADDLTTASWTDLRESAAAIEREVQRRESMDEAAAAEAFAREMSEVRAGTRRADPEHVRHLTPAETLEAVNRGQLLHAGIAPDKRLWRGR
jgi:hypothetical protein